MTRVHSRAFPFSIQHTWAVDAGLLFTLALCAVAALPVLAHPGLFAGHDTLNHAFRVGEFSRQWSEGILFPRWAETFYFGYGSPVFQYYAPLTYYVSAGLARLFSLDALAALRLLVALCPFLSGAGMYLFMREQAGKLGGIIAALVYVYTPYLVFTEPVTRGDYPELLCFALFPLVMWRFERLLRTGKPVDFALAAVSIALFSLAHNLMSVLLFGLLLGWLLWRWLWRHISGDPFRLALAAALLGVGLSAFFWLPVILERDEVQLGNVPVNIQSEQDHLFGFFVPLNRLLASSRLTDAGAANGILLRLNLGLAQWTLALSGLIGIAVLEMLRSRRLTNPSETPPDTDRNVIQSTQDIQASSARSLLLSPAYFALAALFMLALMLPLASGLWESVQSLNFLEFPWRLLGPIAFCLAVLAGMNAMWIGGLPAPVKRLASIGVIILPLALATPTLYVPERRLTTLDTSPAGYLQAEINGLTSPGTSARNDFLPSAVKVRPGATQSLLDDYADGYPVNKANPLSIPSGSHVAVVEHTPASDTWTIQAAAPFTLETFTFAFAGWAAEIDGQPVPASASRPHGFIQIDVPAGDHTLRLYLGETPARWSGIAVSLLSIAGIAVVSLIQRRKPGFQPLPHATVAPSPQPVELATAGLLVALVVALFMREGAAWVQSPPGEAVIAQHQTNYRLGDVIEVIGYDLSAETVRPGDWLEVVVFWYASDTPAHNYTSFVHFSAGEMPLAQADKPLPGGALTSRWMPGAYRRDEYSLRVPDGITPGEYRINLGLYTCDTRPAGECGNGDRLPVMDAQGNPLGDILPLATIMVR